MDPIRGTGYNEYPKRIESSPARTAGNEEKFSLDQSTPREEKEKEKELEANGVVLELSGKSPGRDSASGQQAKAGEQEAGLDVGEAVKQARSFLGSVIRTLAGVWQAVRKAVGDFWNSDTVQTISPEEAEQENPAEELISEAADTASADEMLEAAGTTPADEMSEIVYETLPEETAAPTLRIPDPNAENYREQIQEYLKQINPKDFAKNSDLLTYYDRQGRLVSPSQSDRNRILHGDRSSRKL